MTDQFLNHSLADDFIFTANVIPGEICDFLKSSIAEREWDLHEWYNYAENSRKSRNEKELEVLHVQDANKYVLQFVSSAIEQYTDKLGTGDVISRFNDVRFNRYKTGTLMAPHKDHIHSIFDGECKGIPVLSIVGALNDDFEGGEFICRGKVIDLKKGDVLIFPSCFMYPHEVREITSGTRYSFVMWGY